MPRGFPRSVYRITEEGVEEPPTSFGSWGHPREAYVLLQFDERHYPVARTGVKDLSALTSSPYFKDKHYLQLPQGTSHEDFLTLYFFLSDRGYPPSMKDLSKDASSTGIGQQGPPIIKAYDSISPKQMMPLIAAFQLGAELRYKPLRDHALKGLATLPSTAEDPIEALEKIFLAPSTSQQSATPIATASPDSQLRDWVIRWLQVALPAADWGQYGAIFKTNLSVVRCHPNWSKRFEQLKAKSSAVGEVETMVERQLTFRYFDNNEIMKEIGSPEFGYLSHGQQPLHVPQQFPVPKEAMPVQRSDNRPMGYRGTGDVFDMSNLCKFLPSFGDHQGLHEQLGRPGPSFFVPEQWHAAAAGHQQQQQQQQQRLQQQGLRGVGNLSDPLYPYQLLELWKSGAVNGRPAN
ncbi:MAG: hypothetical protein L6R40_008397 [Gallowayella cf. fulva]|nr:MAG: hypothetical protein L6R40_008397 [Xanthomendoza cf. fulva]